MRLSTIDFGSLFSYAPWGTLDAYLRSKTFRTILKNDEYLVSRSNKILMSDYIADEIKKNIQSLPFADYFNTNTILVPTPTSSLITLGSLWVPQRIARALVRKGLGKTVIECVKRVKALPRSSKSLASNRPKAQDHYDSVEVENILSNPTEILLIDDVVTRGATLLGVANKLADAFPNARIHGFAALRTISDSDQFIKINDSCVGKIKLIGNETYRDP